jgi:gliding motility-associated-like protein
VKRLVCCLLFSFVLLCCWVSGFAQSNKGTEFWTAYMSHINGTGSQMSLYIASDLNADYRVEFADGTLISAGSVTANSSIPVAIPSSAYLGLAEVTPVTGDKKGIHITANRPIAVYAHIYDSNVSGATILLPVSSLSKDYYSINYRQLSNMNPSYSTFAVIATEDGTTVRITPTQNITSGSNTITHAAGTAYNIILNKGEVYQGASLTDLTGTHIESIAVGTGVCKKIAVFSGSSKIYIGGPNSSSDNLFQQVYPTAVWGKNFVTVPLKGRSYDVFRIIYSDISAAVKVNGVAVSPSQLVGGIGYYEFTTPNGSNATNVITSDKPIQVAQYAVTQGNSLGGGFSEGTGDPEMIFLPPVEQGLRRVTLYASKDYRIDDNSFINVVIPTVAASTFTLDGVISGTFTPIAGTPYSYTQLSVGRGSHTISASENFTAIAYGFAQFESYGYAAGTNLLNLNELIVLAGVGSTTTQLNGCVNVPYYLQLTVPYQPKKIIWDPNNGSAPLPLSNPVPYKTETQLNGTVLYSYRYPTPVAYPAGYYNATATVTLPIITSSDCGAEKIVDFSFYITEYPIANFTPPVGTCAGSPVQFTDVSNPVGSVVTRWLWNFGDAAGSSSTNPNISTLQNPQHTYATGGDYTVTLTVYNENDCQSIKTSTQTVHITKNPTAKFTNSTGCSGGAVTFTDQSVANEGTITEWKWDFGDGSPVETYTANPVSLTHPYSASNSYNVTLTVTNSKGCVNTTITQLVISPPPVASFTLPDACITDVAKFSSTSTIADGTENQFTYEWNFGDPNATVAGNQSFAKNGVHLYTQAGNYNITLKVTSKYGCVDEKTMPFFLNGAFPIAKFKMADAICSSEDLVIEDQSTVLPGVITKYEVYYDYDTNPSAVEVYDRDNLPIPTDKLYKHNYGLFNTPMTKSYHVKIIVYSGSSANCSAVFDKTIIVKANPIVTLTHAADICQENNPIQFGQEIKFGFTGTGTFTGAGVSTSGEFNPKKAGPGTHEISYTFIADNTCPYTEKFNIIVYPTPIITGKRDFTINAGSPITLEPLAVSLNSTALTYEWSPSSGLSRSDVASPVASPASDTQYLLTVTSANGCVAKGMFNVSVLLGPTVYNTFTPNGDGVNDLWKIPNMEYFPKSTVEVFNRNGQKVFRSIGYPVPWDGRYNGAALPAGVYYYVIDLKNGKPLLSGPVTIIR